MIRFGPMSDAQDMALIGLYEGEDPSTDEVAEHLELAATLLVICEPPQLGLDDATGAFLFAAPDATMADWRRAGLFEQLYASGIAYDAADAAEQESWDPSEGAPSSSTRLLTLRCGPVPDDFDAALAFVWAAMQERDDSISAGVDPAAQRLATVLLNEVPLGDIRLEATTLTCNLLLSSLEAWAAHPLGRLLHAHRLTHEIVEPAAPSTGISTRRGWSPEHGGSLTRTLPDKRRCLSRLDYEDLLMDTTDAALIEAIGGILSPPRLFSTPPRYTNAQQHEKYQTHNRRQDEDARPQRPDVDERLNPALVNDDEAGQGGERNQADRAHDADMVTR